MSSNRKRANAPEKNNTLFWDERRGGIRSRKGGWVIGEAVYSHGYSMMDDLVGKVSYFQLLVLNVTGRLPERRLADWIEAVFVCMSWPDARIWCNHIGSLAGTMRTTPLTGICAGVLATDSHMYGSGTLVESSEFTIDALAKKRKGMTAEEIVKEYQRRPGAPPLIVGYVRPLASGDERIVAMERVTEKLGFAIGEHLSLAYEIEQVMVKKFNEGMNITGYVNAFLLDQGFSVHEIYSLLSIVVNSGVHACYEETVNQPPESFLPLRCEDIDYQGKPPRSISD